MNRETIYVVLEEHTLGYVYSDWPNHMGFLHASVLRGATQQWGPCPISPIEVDRRQVRPAELKDFDAFRVCPPPDFKPSTHARLQAIVTW